MSKLTGAVGAVLIVSFVAFGFVPIINGAAGNTSTTVTVSAGNSSTITDGLDAFVDDVTADNATVTMANTESGERVTQTIVEGETASFEFDSANATVNVTADQTTADSATLTVQYPRTFGGGNAMDWLADNMGIVLIIVAFISIMAAMKVVIE